MEVCKYDTICYEIKAQRVKMQTFLERGRKANEENQLFLDKFSDPYSIFEASRPDQDLYIFLFIFKRFLQSMNQPF
jgi:hypothetical protein